MERTEKWLLVVAFALLVVALFLNLGIFPLYNEEPRRALIALEMLYSGNLLVPTELGEFYYKKPPFYNWVAIGAFKIFGEGSEFGLRCISVCSLLLMGALTFWFVRKYANLHLAVYSTLFFLISADIFFYFSLSGEIDIFYSLITYASFVAVFHFYRQQKMLALFLSVYALSAIGFLTKGLPSLVFPLVSLAVFFVYNKNFSSFISRQHAAGILVFLAITGAYFYAYSAHNNPLNYFSDLWTQSSSRTVVHTGIFSLLLHLFKFPLLVLKDTLPVSLCLLFLFKKEAWQSLRRNELLQFCLVLFIANILIYWISPGTRSRYHYMLYPLLVIVSTYLYFEFASGALLQKWLQVLIGGSLAVIFLAGCISPLWRSFLDSGSMVWRETLPTVALITVPIVFGGAFYFFKKPIHLWLILLLIICRILFDVLVLPVRAAEGEHVQFKHDAEMIAALTGHDNLFLYRFRGDGTYSLGNAFYLTRLRKQTLRVKQERDCEDFFIVYADEPGHSWKIFYRFTWRTYHYYLVKFTDCAAHG